MKCNVMPETNEQYISIAYGCIRFFDSSRFLSIGLEDLVKTIDNKDFEILRKNFLDKWAYLIKKSISI